MRNPAKGGDARAGETRGEAEGGKQGLGRNYSPDLQRGLDANHGTAHQQIRANQGAFPAAAVWFRAEELRGVDGRGGVVGAGGRFAGGGLGGGVPDGEGVGGRVAEEEGMCGEEGGGGEGGEEGEEEEDEVGAEKVGHCYGDRKSVGAGLVWLAEAG